MSFSSLAGRNYRRTNSFLSYNDPVNEIGGGINYACLINENILSPEINIHYAYYFTYYFSVGAGYSFIPDKHLHNTFTANVSFRTFKNLVTTIKPGIVLKKGSGSFNLFYLIGFETEYEFKISKSFHLGPMIKAEVVQDDVNVMTGIHLGYVF